MYKKLPPVKLNLSAADFNLLLTALEYVASFLPEGALKKNLESTIRKKLQYARLCADEEGQKYVRLYLYESEAADMIWYLLLALDIEVTKDFTRDLKPGSST